MAVIDADAHVIETERTWEFLDEAERSFGPVPVAATAGSDKVYWLIDGKARGRGGNVGKMFPKESRELLDVSARLRHMDELGTDIQVLYPSILTEYTRRPEVEAAFCKSYNRWLADVWGQGEGRLRWACILPLMNIDAAVSELRFARDHGACGVFIRSIEGDRHVIDPYFFPLYEEAQKLDVPICIHASIGNGALESILSQGFEGGNFLKFKLTVVGAFHQLVTNRVPAQFPRLRWGFVETSAQWVPYVVHDLVRRFTLHGEEAPDPRSIMRDNRMYVACQTDDDLPYVLKYSGEDNIVLGTDYGHADLATEMEALIRIRDRDDVEPSVFDKILDANPKALYGL
ncbi:MAG: Amidohydro-rel protein [Chloroflexi bacterium]|nr:Amidohydro-rel protein [Chloroflexota bacterium]